MLFQLQKLGSGTRFDSGHMVHGTSSRKQLWFTVVAEQVSFLWCFENGL
jgi:hypothetical protein